MGKSFYEYDAIRMLAEKVSSLPRDYPVVDVAEERDTSCKKAAEKHYQAGLSYMKQKKYQYAAGKFNKSQTFIPDYKDSKTLEAKGYYQTGVSLMKRGENK